MQFLLQDFLFAVSQIYGVCSFVQAAKLWHELYGTKLAPSAVTATIEDLQKKTTDGLTPFVFAHDYLMDQALFNNNDYKSVLQDAAAFRYAPLTPEELRAYGNIGANLSTPATKKLARYLRSTYHTDELTTDLILVALLRAYARNYEVNVTLKVFSKYKVIFNSEEEVKTAMKLMQNIKQTTRNWALKGHTMLELGLPATSEEEGSTPSCPSFVAKPQTPPKTSLAKRKLTTSTAKEGEIKTVILPFTPRQ